MLEDMRAPLRGLVDDERRDLFAALEGFGAMEVAEV